MQIRAVPNTHDWKVEAEWFGAIRTVFTGTIFECIRFVNTHQ